MCGNVAPHPAAYYCDLFAGRFTLGLASAELRLSLPRPHARGSGRPGMTDNRHSRRLNTRLSRRDPNGPRALNPAALLAALIALTLQLFIVQTHIHGNGAWPGINSAPGVSTDGANTGPVHHPDKFPIKDDPSNCPLCQEFGHAGGYLHSVQIAILPPAASVGELSFAFEFSEPPQHISRPWFGRAPPPESAHA